MFNFYPSVIIVLILALGAKIPTSVRDFQTLILCILSHKKIIDCAFLAFHLGGGGIQFFYFQNFQNTNSQFILAQILCALVVTCTDNLCQNLGFLGKRFILPYQSQCKYISIGDVLTPLLKYHFVEVNCRVYHGERVLGSQN